MRRHRPAASRSSILAIVSKAVFAKMVPKGVALGTVVDIDRYVSSHKTFERVAGAGAIFLVTVRPNQALWLVGILEKPKKNSDAWVSAPNETPLTDITRAIAKLRFASGTGLRSNALAMALQTPRLLADQDVTLLRKLATSKQRVATTKVHTRDGYAEAVDEARRRRRKPFVITHAVRLVRKDLDRLTPLHQKQFNRMMAPKWSFEKAAALIGTEKKGEWDDGGGLAYVRIAAVDDPSRAFEGWIYDTLRYPAKSVSPDGALFFRAGTLEPIDLEMSQSCWHPATSADAKALLDFLESRSLRVSVNGPDLTAHPPFAR